jgi:chemotaxis protein MotB
MTANAKRPIIVIKKKVAHAGHHGGAWKVAYADFVTAMMALFIVLWLTSSGEKVRKSIAGYFNDPTGKTTMIGTDRDGGESIPLNKENIADLKERLQQQIAKRPDLKALADEIQIAITPEGMRIELIESKDGTFFQTGSAVLNATGKELLELLAKELGGVPNRISTEGHTDASPYADATKYDNWELSTDRANAARRVMQATGLHPGQVSQVRGFADQRLRVPSNPFDPSNRRISVIVHYLESAPPAELDVKSGGGKGAVEKSTAAVGKAIAGPVKVGGAGASAPAVPAVQAPAEASKAAATVSLPTPVIPKPSAVHALLNKLPAMPKMPSLQKPAFVSKITNMFSSKSKTPPAPGAPAKP